MARDYKAEYARRKARAIERGHTSPRTERTAQLKSAGRNRDYQLERERERIRAHGVGLDTVAEYRSYMKAKRQGEAAEKRWTLNYFGISESRFNKMRRENKAYAMNKYVWQHWANINTYDLGKDKRVHDWSPMRVGYIKSYNAAVANPGTNYDTLPDNPKFYPGGPHSRKIMDKNQYLYLVKYTNIESVSEFEARYGTNQIGGK